VISPNFTYQPATKVPKGKFHLILPLLVFRFLLFYRTFQPKIPNDPGPMAVLGLAYAKKGMCEEAISILQKGANLYPEDPYLGSALGFSYGVAGKRDEAQKIVSGFMEISKKKYFSPQFISRVYAGMGEVDKAIEWMEKAYEERDPAFSLIKSVPSHDYMHSDPRFKALLKKMGLED